MPPQNPNPMNGRTFLFLIILASLIYGAYQFFPLPQKDSFELELINIKLDAVNTISINMPKEEEFILTRSENDWIATKENLNTKVLKPRVKELLKALQSIKTEKIITTKSEEWSTYGVDEESGIQVQVYENERPKRDFIIGQGTNKDTAYVRFANEVEVYAIDGSQMAPIRESFDNYRDKTFLSLPASAKITDIKLTTALDTFDLKNTGEGWILNEKQVLDSTLIAEYLNKLSYIEGHQFADDFDELKAREFPITQLQITDHHSSEIFEIQCFSDTLNSERDFVLHNRAFPDQYFASDSSGLYQDLINDLLKKLQ
jgi:hypothetical protein